MTVNRIAVVTGANHGIGAAIARAFAQAGTAVLLTGWRVRTPAGAGHPAAYGEQRARPVEEVAASIREAGGRAAAVEADLTDPAVPAQLFDHAEAEFGGVDILVNNASGWRQGRHCGPSAGGPDRCRGENGLPAGHGHRLGHRRGACVRGVERRAHPRRHARRRRGGRTVLCLDAPGLVSGNVIHLR